MFKSSCIPIASTVLCPKVQWLYTWTISKQTSEHVMQSLNSLPELCIGTTKTSHVRANLHTWSVYMPHLQTQTTGSNLIHLRSSVLWHGVRKVISPMAWSQTSPNRLLTFFKHGLHALLLGHCTSEKSQSFSWLYLSAIFTVTGHPSSFTIYPPFGPFLHPYLQCIISSPICSRRAILSTIYLEGLWSMGHISFTRSSTQLLQNVCWK